MLNYFLYLRNFVYPTETIAEVAARTYFSLDGVHPNNKGHDRIAEIFWQGIETTLK